MTRATTVAIAAHKGGVGKTTTAMALASALARASSNPSEVLLIDLDPQGHSTLGLGVDVDDPAIRGATVRGLFEQAPSLLCDVSHATAVAGLRIVPATIQLEATAQMLYARTMRHAVLRDALGQHLASEDDGGRESYCGHVRWFVLDCPPSLGPLVENALTAADLVIVPCRMEARATDGLADLVDKLHVLRGRAFNEWRILRTVVDGRTSVTNAAVDGALRDNYAASLLDTVIPKSEALNQAQIARMDIFSYQPTSAGAVGYVRLAEEVRAWQRSTETP